VALFPGPVPNPKQLRQLRNSIQPKLMKAISDRISGLSDEPKSPGADKVEGYAYRIVYAVEDEALIAGIVWVGHRREV
jgi:mRNA-degrading endonuclease RelE of RelBE toxin-antitoxin system